MSQPFINFKREAIVGAYSVDKDRKYVNNMSGLKYLKIPKSINFDLKEGDYIEKNDDYDPIERIHQLSKFIMDNEKDIIRNGRVDANFVCFRGVLKYLMITPYDKRQPWVIRAVKLKSTIYLSLALEQTEQKDFLKLYQYGFKFESYILSSYPQNELSGKSTAVIGNEEFCVVMPLTINKKITMFVGMECDGVHGENVVESIEDLRKRKLVEVKTRHRGTAKNQENFVKYRSIHWWAQSYIAGIDQIHVGVRDKDGIVDGMKIFDTHQLEENAAKNNYWYGNVCLKYLNQFLERVQNDMRNVTDPQLIFRYEYDPKVSKKIKLQKLSSQDFLSKEFINFMNNVGN